MNPDDFISDREAFLDALEPQVRETIELALGRFLTGLSDDPRDAAVDTLAILLLAHMDPAIRAMPFASRAAEIRDALDLDVSTALPISSVYEGLRGSTMRLAGDLTTRLSAAASDGRTSGARDMARTFLTDILNKLVDTFVQAMLVFERSLLGGQDEYQYVGPRDKKNRAFCRSVLDMGRIFTRAEIENLNAHPDLIPSVPPLVFTMCGGPGCRHMWLPVRRPGTPR